MEISARPSLLHLLSEGPLQSLNPTRACLCLDPLPQLPSTPGRVKPKLLNLTFQVFQGQHGHAHLPLAPPHLSV